MDRAAADPGAARAHLRRAVRPAGSGELDEFDLLRMMAIRHYGALGYSPEALAEALAKDEVQPFLGEYIYPRGERLSLEDAARRLELEPELLRGLRTALGITRPGPLLEHDLKTFETLKLMMSAGMPFEAVMEGARVFGDSLRRVAETETRLVHVHIHERLEAEGIGEDEIVKQIEGLQQAVTPLLDGIVERVHHEHLLLASIEDAYVHLVDTASAGRGSVDATIAFVDVASFTQLAETEGDEAAMALMTRVDSAVRELALARGGKVVKQIGDALMLAFRESAEAVAFAAELERAVRRDESISPLRIGMHGGPAIYRAGDYVGTTVNVAARVASQAAAGETVVTEVVAQRADGKADLEPVGVRMLRGVEKPLSLYRLRHEDERQDPVCGRTVSSPPTARLQQGDDELWFCSRECLRTYLASEPATAPGHP